MNSEVQAQTPPFKRRHLSLDCTIFYGDCSRIWRWKGYFFHRQSQLNM